MTNTLLIILGVLLFIALALFLIMSSCAMIVEIYDTIKGMFGK